MPRTWQLQEAKNRFSEVVDRALHDGPQAVTRRGKEVVVVVSADELRRASRPKIGLIEFFRGSPLYRARSEDQAECQSLPGDRS